MKFLFLAAAAAAPLAAAFTVSPPAALTRAGYGSALTARSFSPASVTASSHRVSTLLRMASGEQAVIDDTIAAAGSGVALFGKSDCPSCKKAKAALLAEGVYPVIVEVDEVENGKAIQTALEASTGKATVPVVFLDGKFIGGSEEVLAGLESDMFDAVEKGEKVVVEEKKKVPVPINPLAIKVGDTVPTTPLFSEFSDQNLVNLVEYSKDRSILVIGLPGAFTPTWSAQQIPSYLAQQDALKEAGIDEVCIYCVNDPAVMGAWAKDQGVTDDGMITFLADSSSAFTKEVGMELIHPGPMGKGLLGRCKRFALHIVDGICKAVVISEAEDDPAGDDDPETTLAPAMIATIKAE